MSKIRDMIKCFDGSGDVSQWLAKVKLVSELNEIEEVSKIIPLFLEGAAFSVYAEMDAQDKDNAEKIEETLLLAFATNAFTAYEEFCRRVWRDEPVDVYMTDLRRLARLAGVETDMLLMRAFIVGLPSAISRDLRAVSKIETMSLSEVVQRARCLISELSESSVSAAAVNVNERRSVVAKKRCFKCGGSHFTRFCRSTPRGDFKCWTCGEAGHISRNCHQGNDNGRISAPAVLPQEQ